MKRMVFAAMAAMAVVGCGPSADEKRAEEAIKAAQEAGEAAKQAGQAAQQAGEAARQAGAAAVQSAQGGAPGAPGAPVPPQAPTDLHAMAKGLEALAGGGASGGARVDPVRYQDLIAMLPKVEGWEMREPQGQRMTSPFPTASAEAVYRSGASRVEVEIVDTANNQMLLAPISMFLQVGYAQESTRGYEKAMQLNGHPGWEKWDISSKRGEVNALVGKRFIVTVKGNNVDDTKVLQQFAQRVDFNSLAALK
jgi:hypothetical protein